MTKTVQKLKIKNVHWPITAKMTAPTQFPKIESSTPHRYKMTLRAYVFNSPQIFARCHIGLQVSSKDSFVVIALSTYC